MRACVVVTPSPYYCGTSKRIPLRRLVLPESIAMNWQRINAKRVWWIEAFRRHKFVRALCHVTTPFECVRDHRNAQFTVEVQPDASERVTWSHGSTRFLANAAIPLPASGVQEITADQEAALERVRVATASVSTFPGAKRRIQALLKQTVAERPPVLQQSLCFEDALRYVREHFARAELVAVSDLDPFCVAAHVLVDDPLPEMTSADEYVYMPAWRPFGHENVVSPGDSSARTICPSGLSVEVTHRHHSIVRQLATTLRRYGAKPHYNKHLDLAVAASSVDILFEVKTATPANFREQLRLAVGQLLEYRYLLARKPHRRQIRVAVVIEGCAESRDELYAHGFLLSVGISLVIWREQSGAFDGLRELLATCD